MFADTELILKIAGAVVVFALGIWIGLGTPGLKRTRKAGEWQPADRFRATWINRVFFRMDRAPRRFDAGRLIVPKEQGEVRSGTQADEEDEGASDVVRLRRPGEG